jgi:hypothetical protein
MDDQDKIDLILDWAETHTYFDTAFVLRMQARLEQFGSLSQAQIHSLENIIDKFGIE